MDKSLSSMLDVSSTMLITLYARARESMCKTPLINDSKAVEMIEIIKKEIQGSENPIHKKILTDRYNPKLFVSMSLRCRRFDQYVLDFLKRNPAGTVINMGCGLDTRFYRIDNGSVRWFDIDFPEVMDLRRRFMQENDRCHFITGSILNREWIQIVKNGGPYLILAEGVFMYLQEVDVKNLLNMIVDELGNAELVCEVTNTYWVRKMKSKYMKWKFSHQLGMSGSSIFTFGIPYSQYFEEWDPRFHFLDEWTYFDDHEKRLGWFNLISWVEVIRKVQWIVHYQIGV